MSSQWIAEQYNTAAHAMHNLTEDLFRKAREGTPTTCRCKLRRIARRAKSTTDKTRPDIFGAVWIHSPPSESTLAEQVEQAAIEKH